MSCVCLNISDALACVFRGGAFCAGKLGLDPFDYEQYGLISPCKSA